MSESEAKRRAEGRDGGLPSPGGDVDGDSEAEALVRLRSVGLGWRARFVPCLHIIVSVYYSGVVLVLFRGTIMVIPSSSAGKRTVRCLPFCG